MKLFKITLKLLFWLMIIALLILPLGLIYQVSSAEMQEYAAPESPVIREISMGEPKPALRMDVKEYVTLTGTFTSTEIAFMNLNYYAPSEIRWAVSVGDEIQQGQVLGYYREAPVVAEQDGILEEIHTFTTSDSYLKIRCFAPLELECKVDDKVLASLKRGSDKLCLEDGTSVILTYAAKAKNEDGTTTVRLSLDSLDYAYGQNMKDLNIYTGGGFPQVLVLDADCVYQKEKGEDAPWYARRVTEDGYFIEEVQVKVSYASGSVVCVSGINEGDYFDSGYKAIVEGDSK